MGKLQFGRIVFETSNEDKLFYPADQITKGDLIDYYTGAAERMLPQLRGRPLSLQRYPDGIEKNGFFQKDAPDHYPGWITRTVVRKKGGSNHHVVADKKATLAYLANNGVVTIHGALSKEPDLEKPDRLVFDLDPSVDDFGVVREGAQAVREVLDKLGLPSFLQVTGSRGLHVVVPLRPRLPFDDVSAFAKGVAEKVVVSDPDSYTIEHRKNKRGDRLLIDYFRNQYAQTAVIAYSLRPKPGAPAAMPIEWSELGSVTTAGAFPMKKALTRIRKGTDPWRHIGRRAHALDAAIERLPKI